MRVYFVGATQFGLRCLEALTQLEEIEVVGVLTAPPEFRISYSEEPVRNVMWTDFSPIAVARNIPLHRMESSMLDPDLEFIVFRQKPDCIFVAGWYHMVPRKWLANTTVYGLHASLLPTYRGGAPLVWAMINGERKTGVTLFEMDQGIDSGPILSAREVDIEGDDEIGDLIYKAEKASLSMITEDFPLIASGRIQAKAQPEGDWAVMPQRSPSDGKISWNMKCVEVARFIRAQAPPYPGAFFDQDEYRIHLRRCRVASELAIQASPGTVVKVSDKFFVRCKDGWVELVQFDSAGSRENAMMALEQLASLFRPTDSEA